MYIQTFSEKRVMAIDIYVNILYETKNCSSLQLWCRNWTRLSKKISIISTEKWRINQQLFKKLNINSIDELIELCKRYCKKLKNNEFKKTIKLKQNKKEAII